MIRRLDRYLPLHASYYCVLVEIVNLCVDGAKIRRFSEHIERRPRLLDRGFSQSSTSVSYCSAEPGLPVEAYGKNRLRNDALGAARIEIACGGIVDTGGVRHRPACVDFSRGWPRRNSNRRCVEWHGAIFSATRMERSNALCLHPPVPGLM